MKRVLTDPVAGSLQSAIWEAGHVRASLRRPWAWEAVRQLAVAHKWLGLASGFMAQPAMRSVYGSSRERVARLLDVLEAEVTAAWPRPRQRAVVRRGP